MALRDILKEDDNALRTKAKEVTVFDKRLWTLLDDMKETMQKADGVGLAAPQVGILKRVAVVDYNGEYLELINPKVLLCEGEAIEAEGCLSIDNSKNCRVARPEKIKLTALDRHGNKKTYEKKGWIARVICHELDHLDGVLFIDKKSEK